VTKERWTFRRSGEFGNLFDSRPAPRQRKQPDPHGYAWIKIQFSSAIEFRRDDAQQPDLTHTLQTVLLCVTTSNTNDAQLATARQKLDHSISNSSLGDFYAGGYTEGVVGYAYGRCGMTPERPGQVPHTS